MSGGGYSGQFQYQQQQQAPMDQSAPPPHQAYGHPQGQPQGHPQGHAQGHPQGHPQGQPPQAMQGYGQSGPPSQGPMGGAGSPYAGPQGPPSHTSQPRTPHSVGGPPSNNPPSNPPSQGPAQPPAQPDLPVNPFADPIHKAQGLILKELRESVISVIKDLQRLALLVTKERKAEVGEEDSKDGVKEENPASANPASVNPASVNPASVKALEEEDGRKASPRKAAVTSVQKNLESFEAICDQIELHFLSIQECLKSSGTGTKLRADKHLGMGIRADSELRAPGQPLSITASEARRLTQHSVRYADLLKEMFHDTLVRLEGTEGEAQRAPQPTPLLTPQPLHLPHNIMEPKQETF